MARQFSQFTLNKSMNQPQPMPVIETEDYANYGTFRVSWKQI
jgi:hypothetical protein